MEANKMMVFMNDCRRDFRQMLSKTGGTKTNEFAGLLKGMLDECCSAFEEETLKENLQEELREYMDSLKAA